MKGVVIMTYGPIAQQYMMPHTNAGIRNDNYEIQIYSPMGRRYE
jgi:hypothetical protein